MSMDKVIDKLYVGDYLSSIDRTLLNKSNITHIVTILDQCRQHFKDLNYFLIKLPDSPTVDIMKHFAGVVDFIHNARLRGHSVLVHCAQGVSRSVTVVVAYLMAISRLPWQRCLNAVQRSRQIANPNFGFRSQLQQHERVLRSQPRLKKYTDYATRAEDIKKLQKLLPASAVQRVT